VTGLYLDHGVTGPLGGPAATLPAATAAAVTFFVREAGGRLTLSVLYPKGVLDDDMMTGVARSYLELLTALCDTPEVPLSELELPSAAAPLSAAAAAPTAPGPPTLRKVTHLAPAEALSPVGIWAPVPRPRP
jgi:non-ribosomal peptide synthetase component F